MTKVLIYYNRKTDLPTILDASTPEKEDAAFLQLYHYLDEVWEVYECDELTAKEKKLRAKAKDGDVAAAKMLLTSRIKFEYEEWRIGYLLDPLIDEIP